MSFPKSNNKYEHDIALELRFNIESNLDKDEIIKMFESFNTFDLMLWLTMKANASELTKDGVISDMRVLGTTELKYN